MSKGVVCVTCGSAAQPTSQYQSINTWYHTWDGAAEKAKAPRINSFVKHLIYLYPKDRNRCYGRWQTAKRRPLTPNPPAKYSEGFRWLVAERKALCLSYVAVRDASVCSTLIESRFSWLIPEPLGMARGSYSGRFLQNHWAYMTLLWSSTPAVRGTGKVWLMKFK